MNLGYIIRNVDGDGERILDIPKGWWDHSVAWMDNDESVLICAFDDVDHIRDPDRSMQLYRYDLATDEITQLTQDLESKMHVDWISDEVYAVSPAGKYPVRWVNSKRYIQTRSDVLSKTGLLECDITDW